MITSNDERAVTQIVIFHRAEGWYPLELPVTDDLVSHAENNPGTIKISDIDGNILWSLQ